MGSLFHVFVVGAIVAGLMILAALFTPKGPNQLVIRTDIMLALACTYLLWMITYLAQLHPLVAPVKSVNAKASH